MVHKNGLSFRSSGIHVFHKITPPKMFTNLKRKHLPGSKFLVKLRIRQFLSENIFIEHRPGLPPLNAMMSVILSKVNYN